MASKDLPSKIMDLLVTEITAKCQTAIEETDPTYARQIALGRFQDDPTDYGVIIRVHRNDPAKTDRTGSGGWPDERLDPLEMGHAVIGGVSPEFWMRRFTVIAHVWPVGKVQADAQAVNGEVIARLRHTLSAYQIPLGTSDVYGEAILERINPVTSIMTDEGGGPDDEYSWRTTLYLQYMTHINPKGV